MSATRDSRKQNHDETSFSRCAHHLTAGFRPPLEAQQPKKVPRIGYLSAGGSNCSGRCEAFRQGICELGYVEGENLIAEYRSGEGKSDRPPALAAEFFDLKVDIIVTSGSTDTRAAKKATHSIPIVMTQDIDPVGNGFVASLARPGGNVTGLANLSSEISGKRLELLKESIPRLTRAAVIWHPPSARKDETERKDIKLTAESLAVKLQSLAVGVEIISTLPLMRHVNKKPPQC